MSSRRRRRIHSGRHRGPTVAIAFYPADSADSSYPPYPSDTIYPSNPRNSLTRVVINSVGAIHLSMTPGCIGIETVIR